LYSVTNYLQFPISGPR